MQKTVDLPEWASHLFEPHRFKVVKGGRGGAKSHTFAAALLIIAAQSPKRIFCGREIQRSIQESVHRLLSDKIVDMGMTGVYEVQQSRILGKNGSEIIYGGLRHNMASHKSLEGIDIFWGEEAQTFSQTTLDILLPTIRKPDSELWFSYNPDLEDDPVHQMFAMGSEPKGTWLHHVNFDDNPWCTPELLDQAEHCRITNPAKYKHIWLGQCKQAIDGAIFADEIEAAQSNGRITRVPVASGVPVHTFWDLGQSDATAIWFCQLVGMEYRLIDYYQDSGKKMPHYIQILADKGYNYGKHYLPHDADYDQLAASATIKQQMQQALRDNPKLGDAVEIVPRVQQKAIAINAARTIFEQCLFDKEKTADGMQCLRRYRYATDEATGRVSKNPMHDMWSHGADAFMQLAQYAKAPSLVKKKTMKIETKWIK